MQLIFDLVVVTPLSMMNVVISWAIQTVFVRRIICPCLYRMRSERFCAEDRGFLSEAGQFPFGFANWRKGDPNVSVQRIDTSFRKRRNSLSGLQIGEKAIQTFLCKGSILPFGSGAIPFRVCKLAKRRSKRFLCGGSRLPFGSEAIPFRETFGVHRNAPTVHRTCTGSAPGVHQKCTKNEPGENQKSWVPLGFLSSALLFITWQHGVPA